MSVKNIFVFEEHTLASLQIQKIQELLDEKHEIQEIYSLLAGADDDFTWDDMTRLGFIDGSYIDIDVQTKFCRTGFSSNYIIADENKDKLEALMIAAQLALIKREST